MSRFDQVGKSGDSVYVVGSSVELGNWDVTKAVRLADTSAYPSWSGKVELTANEKVEWKCIIRSESSPSQVRHWEPGANNVVTASKGATTLGAF